jgi:ABC-2 type transport system permease protein
MSAFSAQPPALPIDAGAAAPSTQASGHQDSGPPISKPNSRVPVTTRLLRLAERLNPALLLFGPIFQKEVRSAGRKRAGYLGRALYALALLIVVGLVFWAMWRDLAITNSAVQRLQQMQQLAPVLAVTVIWFQFIMLALMGPNLTGPAIADEKRTGTLSALLTTPMTAGQIVGGKLSGRLVHVVILTLLATPLLLAVRIFGGLDAAFVLQALAISFSTAILGATLGLLFSIWNRRATGAAVFGLLTLALFQALAPAIDGMLYYWFSDQGYTFHSQTLALCSPAALFEGTYAAIQGAPTPTVSVFLVDPSPGNPGGIVLNLGPVWLVSTIYTLALALGFAMLASVILRRTMLKEGARDAGSATDRPTTRVSKRSKRARTETAAAAGLADAPPTERPAPSALDAPNPKSRSRAAPHRDRIVGEKPVLWREIRQPTFGSRRRFLIAAGVTLCGLLFLYINFGIRDNEGLHGTMAVIGALAVMLQSVFMTTGGFVGEREGRTWDVLLTTPLSGGEISFGKLIGCLRAQWFLPAVVLAHFALTAALGYIHPVVVLHLVLIFAGPVLLFSSTGLLLSLILKKSTPASVCNLLLALLFWLVPWLLLALIAFLLQTSRNYSGRDPLESMANVLAAFNPVVMAVTAYDPALHKHITGTATAITYDFPSTSGISLDAFTLILVGIFVLYASAAAAVFWATVASFKRWSGRTS